MTYKKRLLSMIASGLSAGSLSMASPVSVQTLNEQARLTVPVSAHDLNRISVQGDRIHQVFGAEGKFHVETDDESGQLFIRPVNASDLKPVQISLVTENGITQDLKLLPQDMESASLILKSTAPAHKTNGYPAAVIGEDHVSGLLKLIRSAVSPQTDENLIPVSCSASERIPSSGLSLIPLQCWSQGPYLVTRYRLTNTGLSPISLSESSLSRPKDLAVALGAPGLKAGASASLVTVEGKDVNR